MIQPHVEFAKIHVSFLVGRKYVVFSFSAGFAPLIY